MSGQFPTSVDLSNVEFESVETILKSRSISLKRQVRRIGGHLWRVTVGFNLMSNDEFKDTWAFLLDQESGLETFTFTIPGHDDARGAVLGSPTYTSTTNDYQIVTGGWTPSITNQVKKGDVFTIAGDSKVYFSTENMNSNGSGVGTLTFYPALMKTPSNNAVITFNNVNFTCELEEPPSYTREGPFYLINDLKLLEAY